METDYFFVLLILEKLWTAPEILRNPSAFPPNGTKAGDSYSFAIILHEMLFRKGVFYRDDEPSPKGIFCRDEFLLISQRDQ